MDFRKTEIFKNGEWIEVEFKDILKGNLFRLIESTGEIVSDKGETEFIAVSDAYLNKDGIWEVGSKH